MSAVPSQVLPLSERHQALVPAYRIPVYAACTLLALLTNYVFGKDMAFDTLNYHLYAGFSALHNRFGQDYFPAGMQTYLNPYAYVPFYALVHAGLSSLQVSSILAIFQSGLLWLSYEFGRQVCPFADSRIRLLAGLCAVAFTYESPVVMQQFGSTFADITTGELVLGGWLLLAGAIAAPAATKVAWAGLLIGAATALKMTNAIHAIAGFAVLSVAPLALSGLLRYGLLYGGSLAVGFVTFAAPWSYQLARTFGNPLFPLLNNVFHSPNLTVAPILYYRYIPETFLTALWRPFAIAVPNWRIDEELLSPDVRYAVLVLLAFALLLRWLWRRLSTRPPERDGGALPAGVRVLAGVGCGVTVDWIAWLRESGNIRYFLPITCVAGVVVVGLMLYLCARHYKLRNYLLLALFTVQGVQLAYATEFRWNPAPWTNPWVRVTLPAPLAQQPNLYLTLGHQSNSFLIPYFPKESGFINFTGDYELNDRGANGAKIKALIRRYSPRVRMLMVGDALHENIKEIPNQMDVDAELSVFGLRANPSDCLPISAYGLPEPLLGFSNNAKLSVPSPDTEHLISCGVVPDTSDHSAVLAERQAAERVLDRVEAACPALFQPSGMASEHMGPTWERFYFNTDVKLWVSRGWVKFSDPDRGDGVTFIGRESDWLRTPLPLICGRRDGHYFARVPVS